MPSTVVCWACQTSISVPTGSTESGEPFHCPVCNAYIALSRPTPVPANTVPVEEDWALAAEPAPADPPNPDTRRPTWQLAMLPLFVCLSALGGAALSLTVCITLWILPAADRKHPPEAGQAKAGPAGAAEQDARKPKTSEKKLITPS